MKKIISSLLTLALISVSGATWAQSGNYHPALTDRFGASLGWMKSSNSFKVSAAGRTIDFDDDEIDFDDSLGVSDSSTFLNAQFGWRFGNERKWVLGGQYFANSADGDATLTEDVEWEDVIFREGSFVGAGVELEVYRVFIGRSLVKNEQHDFGIGAGLHILDLSAYIEGQIAVNDQVSDFYRGDVGESQPLPNVGGWYQFSPHKRWLLFARVDWISANIDKYDGTLWNTSVGVNFQAWDHVGFDLYWQYFNLNLNVDGSDWRGGVDLEYSGPVLGVTFNW